MSKQFQDVCNHVCMYIYICIYIYTYIYLFMYVCIYTERQEGGREGGRERERESERERERERTDDSITLNINPQHGTGNSNRNQAPPHNGMRQLGGHETATSNYTSQIRVAVGLEHRLVPS